MAALRAEGHGAVRLEFYMACKITELSYKLKEFILDYFNPNLDLAVQTRRESALFEGRDEHAHDMFWLLYDALVYGQEPAEYDDVDTDGNHGAGGDQDCAVVDEESDGGDAGMSCFTKRPVSAAGFVGVRHMRMCIRAFVDLYIDVDDEGADEDGDRLFLANFMSATGFVNRLWDVRRIIEVYLDTGLDLETRRATVSAMLGELEKLLKARARAVSTGSFKLQ